MSVPTLIDVNEGRRITGLEKPTLYRLVKQGRVRGYRVLGRALRFDRAELLALVQDRPAGRSRAGGAEIDQPE
jgi:excisionase family DNA binding protein